MQLRKGFLTATASLLALSALMSIGALMLASQPAWSVIGSVVVLTCASIVAQMLAVVHDRGRLRPVVYTGYALVGASAVLWLMLIWFESRVGWKTEELIVRCAGTLTIPALVVAQCALLLLPKIHTREIVIVRWATVGTSMTAGLYILSLIWFGDAMSRFISEDVMFRVLGVVIILAASGTLLTPVLWKMETLHRRESSESIPLNVNLDLVCPRCRTMQSLTPGPRECTTCGLRINIDVEEPRCACGYLLHQLVSDHCPECGKAVAERDRWAA